MSKCGFRVRAWAGLGEEGEFVPFGETNVFIDLNSTGGLSEFKCAVKEVFTDDTYKDLFTKLAESLYHSVVDSSSPSPFKKKTNERLENFFACLFNSNLPFSNGMNDTNRLKSKKIDKSRLNSALNSTYDLKSGTDKKDTFVEDCKQYLINCLIEGFDNSTMASRFIVGIFKISEQWQVLNKETQIELEVNEGSENDINIYFFRMCKVSKSSGDAEYLTQETDSGNALLVNPFACEAPIFFHQKADGNSEIYLQPGNHKVVVYKSKSAQDKVRGLLFNWVKLEESALLRPPNSIEKMFYGGTLYHPEITATLTSAPDGDFSENFKKTAPSENTDESDTAAYLGKINALTPLMLSTSATINTNIKRLDKINRALFARSDSIYDTDLKTLETLACDTMYLFQILQAYRFRLNARKGNMKDILKSFNEAISTNKAPVTEENKKKILEYYEQFYKDEALNKYTLLASAIPKANSSATLTGYLENIAANFSFSNTTYKNFFGFIGFRQYQDAISAALSRAWLGFSGIGVSNFSWGGSTSINISEKSVQALTVANELEMAVEYTERVTANFSLFEQNRQQALPT